MRTLMFVTLGLVGLFLGAFSANAGPELTPTLRTHLQR